jgi:hypothetical protein
MEKKEESTEEDIMAGLLHLAPFGLRTRDLPAAVESCERALVAPESR